MSLCAGAGFQEYCHDESFRAACYQPDEVVTITHAQYGVMSRGRCLGEQVVDPDCYADVTRQLAGVCSGRRSCELPVNSDQLKADMCPGDAAFSLNASFSCVKGLKPASVISARVMLTSSLAAEYGNIRLLPIDEALMLPLTLLL